MKTLYTSSLGIDISKYYLDVCYLPSNISKKYENSSQGIQELIKWIVKIRVYLVIFEPTGGYEKLLRILLTKENIPFSVVNAKRIRDYAKAKGLFAKNDKIDANLIAEYAIKMQPIITSTISSELELLRDWLKLRSQLIDNIKNERQHLEHLKCQDIINIIQGKISYLE